MTKDLYFADTSLSVKYNKTSKMLCLYKIYNESLLTNIAFSFASSIFATQLSPQVVYFIQTGGSALSLDGLC